MISDYMVEQWRKWKHITKLDPDKKVTPSIIETIIDTGTDAIMISGTLNITREKVKALIDMLKEYDIPKILEPAGPNAMFYKDVDWIFVPTVFNTNNPKWINGVHKSWVKYDKEIDWSKVVPEAYIILNPKCSAARYTEAKPIPKEDVVAAALCAEKFFKIPIVYIEYSGTYGDPEIVKAVSEALKESHLFYGGGINTIEKAEIMSKYATIVVGNTIYEKGAESFVSTKKGALLQELKNIQEKLKRLKSVKHNGKPVEKQIENYEKVMGKKRFFFKHKAKDYEAEDFNYDSKEEAPYAKEYEEPKDKRRSRVKHISD